VAEEVLQELGYFIVADESGVVHRPGIHGDKAYAGTALRHRAVELVHLFDHAWQLATRDRRLRPLHL
jgi:hypothetical protein